MFSTAMYGAASSTGGSIPFPLWIAIVVVLVTIGGFLAFTRGRRK
ncbi:hypothetical protein [Curtobacterium sp. MCPF17_031]|nr:hypothetical protein [Curtobacterium sp. MCPF17_031]